MVIKEEGSNFPSVLGRKNVPSTKSWAPGASIASLPSLTRGRRSILPQIFAQLPSRGTGLIRGTARTGLERGRGIPLTRVERLTRHKELYGQKMSVMSDGYVKSESDKYSAQMFPLLNRSRLLGTLGILNPQKNIPLPWGPRTWPTEAKVGELPSVIKTGIGASGPTRTMHPEISLVPE